jgi:chromosome partitioning protein
MPIVVAFVSQKGGVGKSTLARALLAVASHVMTVRLADLDPYQASVMEMEESPQPQRGGSGGRGRGVRIGRGGDPR